MKDLLKKINLKPRERYALMAGAGFLAAFVLLQLVIFPIYDTRARLTRTVQGKKKELAEIKLLKADYDVIRSQAAYSQNQIQNRDRGFTLFSFLDRLAGQKGLKDRISYMKPSKTEKENSPYQVSIVEMELQRITLQQLVDYLYGIETSANLISVKRMSITESGKPAEFIDVVLQVETFEL